MTVKVTVRDVYNRDLTLRNYTQAAVIPSALYENAIESTSFSIIENSIKNWRGLDVNETAALYKAIDLFEHATEFCSAGQLNKMATEIAESSISKVRDGSQTAAYIKRKLARFKTKLHTKTSKKLQDIADISSKLPKAIASVQPKASDQEVQEAYDIMLNKALIIEQCDRVIRNDKKLSKRFNLDKVAYHAESVEDFTLETCALIDTYAIPYYAKYSLALENCMYTLYRNHIKFGTKDIVEAATTYYLMKDIDANYVAGIAKILTENRMLGREDISTVDYVMNPNNDLISECMDNILDSVSYTSIMTNSLLEYSSKDFAKTLETKKNQVKSLLDNYKLLPKKSVESFKALIPKIFSKTESEIINEIPSFFTILRSFFVLGSFGINPVLGLLTAFTNHMLGMHFSREQMPKIIDKYKKEVKKVEGKLENASGEKKERLEKYLHELNYDLDKLTNYYDSIRTEKEKDDDFNSDDDDFDFGFDEAVKDLAVDLQLMVELLESIDLSKIEVPNMNYIFKPESPIADNSIMDNYASCCAALIPDNTIRAALREGFENEYDKIRHSQAPDRYLRLEYARSARSLYEYTLMLEESDNFTYNMNQLASLYELCNIAAVLSDAGVEYIVEDTSFTNKLKLAGEKLKKTAANLSDKEKMMSKRIDGSMESLRRSIEKSLTTDNREAIIKGQVVPSASKIIKMAITGGVAWAVNPCIAVIGAIGALAMSKKLQKKERQLLLDEINIELEMCEKYLKIAEEKDDMKATRELLQIQKRLQREKARITYKAKYQYNDNVETSTADRD